MCVANAIDNFEVHDIFGHVRMENVDNDYDTDADIDADVGGCPWFICSRCAQLLFPVQFAVYQNEDLVIAKSADAIEMFDGIEYRCPLCDAFLESRQITEMIPSTDINDDQIDAFTRQYAFLNANKMETVNL